MHPNCRCSISPYEDSEEYEDWINYLANGGSTEQWIKGIKFILSDDERKSVNDYISSYSYIINDKLRNNYALTDSDKTFIKHLDSSLNKIPN